MMDVTWVPEVPEAQVSLPSRITLSWSQLEIEDQTWVVPGVSHDLYTSRGRRMSTEEQMKGLLGDLERFQCATSQYGISSRDPPIPADYLLTV